MSEENLPFDKAVQLEKGTKSVETIVYGQKKKIIPEKPGYICTVCGDFIIGKEATKAQLEKAMAEHRKSKHDSTEYR